MDLSYRKDIDGLRALAILPVIWTHAGLPYLGGGFLGVDVFFVISGFLITSILLRELDSGSFSIVNFYERRARRILPALLFMILITSLFIPFVSTSPEYLSDFGSSALSGVLFVSNIYFWQTSGYFGTASELSPLLHIWSLAVEEQYYLFFPIFLAIFYRFGIKTVFWSLTFIIAISLALATWGSENSPNASFYLLPTRVWELLVGALAAVYYGSAFVEAIRCRFSSQISLLSLAVIIASYFLFTSSTLHPSYLTIPVVLGTAFILLFNKSDSSIGKILSMRPFVFVGLISYSLYLWHQPILAFMKKTSSFHLNLSQITIAVVLTFVLSYISWKFVENPFRNKTKFSRARIFKYSLLSLTLFAVVSGAFMFNYQIQKQLFPTEMARYEMFVTANETHVNQKVWEEECKFLSDGFENDFIIKFEKCSQKYGSAMVIIGGSHGIDLYNAIAMNIQQPFIVSVSKGYCRAHEFIGKLNQDPGCQYEDVKDFLNSYGDSVSQLIYTQTPDRLFSGVGMKNADYNDLNIGLVEQVVSYLADLKTSYNVDVMMIGMLPPLELSPIDWSYNEPVHEQYDNIVSYNAISLSERIDDLFDKRLGNHQIPYLSKIQAFSLSLPNDLLIDGEITYSDRRHISLAGERAFGKRLVNYLSGHGKDTF